jgi:hypothetical protein
LRNKKKGLLPARRFLSWKHAKLSPVSHVLAEAEHMLYRRRAFYFSPLRNHLMIEHEGEA